MRKLSLPNNDDKKCLLYSNYKINLLVKRKPALNKLKLNNLNEIEIQNISALRFMPRPKIQVNKQSQTSQSKTYNQSKTQVMLKEKVVPFKFEPEFSNPKSDGFLKPNESKRLHTDDYLDRLVKSGGESIKNEIQRRLTDYMDKSNEYIKFPVEIYSKSARSAGSKSTAAENETPRNRNKSVKFRSPI